MSNATEPPRLRPTAPDRISSSSYSPRSSRHSHFGIEGQVPIREMSPTSKLRIFTRAEELLPTQNVSLETGEEEAKLIQRLSLASSSEKALGVRVSKAAQKLQAWCREIEAWGWSGGFHDQEELQENGTSRHSNIVQQHEPRISAIRDELHDIEIEGLKERVRQIHQDRLRPSSSHSTYSTFSAVERKSLQFAPLDDFEILVTQTLIQALPDLSILNTLLDTWDARLYVLKQAPQWLDDLRQGERALYLAWEALRKERERLKSDKDAGHVKNGDVLHSDFVGAYAIMAKVLRGKIESLGRRLDRMLDVLEGHSDVLPDKWIDDFENLEAGYTNWVVASDRTIMKLEVEELPPKQEVLDDVEAMSGHALDSETADAKQSHMASAAAEEQRLPKQDANFAEPRETSEVHEKDDIVRRSSSRQSKQNSATLTSSPHLEPPSPSLSLQKQPLHPISPELVDNAANALADIPLPPQPNVAWESEVIVNAENNMDRSGITLVPEGADVVHNTRLRGESIKDPPVKQQFTSPEKMPASDMSLDGTHEQARRGLGLFDSQQTLEDEAKSSGNGTSTSSPHAGKIDYLDPDVPIESIETEEPANDLSPDLDGSADDIEEDDDEEELVVGEPSRVVRRASTASVESFSRQQAKMITICRRDSSASATSLHDGPQTPRLLGTPTKPSEPKTQSTSSGLGLSTVGNDMAEDSPLSPDFFRNRPVRGESMSSISSGFSQPRSPLRASPLLADEDSPSTRIPRSQPSRLPRPPLNSYMQKKRIPSEPPWPPRQFTEPSRSEGGAKNSEADSSPTRDGAEGEGGDALSRQISDILTKIPTHIRLTSGVTDEMETSNAAKQRNLNSNQPRPVRSLRSATQSPALILSPAKPVSSRHPNNTNVSSVTAASSLASSSRRSTQTAGHSSAEPDIKLYHLSQPGVAKPIKLFVRRVGENGERVMVRVGGGWADLGEYLRQYVEHHGRRTVSDGRIESLEPVLPPSSDFIPQSATHARPPSGLYRNNTSSPPPHASPTIPNDYTSPSHLTRPLRRDPTPTPSTTTTTPATTPRLGGGPFSASSTSSSPWATTSSQAAAAPETQQVIGLAGPRPKQNRPTEPLSEEKMEWIEGMMVQARQLSYSSSAAAASSTTTAAGSSATNQTAHSRRPSYGTSASMTAASTGGLGLSAGGGGGGGVGKAGAAMTKNSAEVGVGDLGRVGGTRRVFLRGGAMQAQHANGNGNANGNGLPE